MQKSIAFLYTNNELSWGETRKTIPFTVASKIIKYLGINLTKNIKDLYSENYKKLKKIQIRGSIYHIHGLRELTSLKCPNYPKQSTDSMQFQLRYQWCIPQN